MSNIKLVSPMLDNFHIGDPISDHDGIRCCPAMRKDSDDKYIVKIISVPASQVQYDALLLTGACSDRESALAYFNELANSVIDEVKTLERLSTLEGFLPIDDYQIVPMEDDVGYDIYLLTKYQKTLTKQMRNQAMTHLGAINLGIDLCAALSVCRKLGYLYVDLKPSNVYLFGEQGYRIGDVGFIKLDSLKYASLPEAYRSAYTAPEIADAYSALNTSIDIYALGLILYQVYNGGVLPVENPDTGAFPPPVHADYEMCEIILKACASNPEERWQDPIDMGQALVGYMQRNGANDTLIVPCVEPTPVEVITTNEQDTSDEILVNTNSQENVENVEYAEDELGNLSFLDDSQEESAPNEEETDIAYTEVTDEVSEILAAADELISQPTSEPLFDSIAIEDPVSIPLEVESEAEMNDAGADDKIVEESEVPESELISASSAAESTADLSNDACEETTEDAPVTDEADGEAVREDETPEQASAENETAEETAAPKKKSSWWKGLIIALLIAGIGAAGYIYYTFCYLQPVSMELSGSENKLTVSVDCALDDLFVICTDAYGNQYKESVVNGQAEFDTLASNTVYTVTVDTNKFHKLTGSTSASYQTEVQTRIVQFTAVNGAEAGDVILKFSVEGPASEQWHLLFAPTGGSEESLTFSGNQINLSDLNIGTQYTFRLEPATDLYFDQNNAITFTPATPIQAEKLLVSGYTENSITLTWKAPENANIDKWIVQCYDDGIYNQTIVTSELSATFADIDPEHFYTIKVVAENMSVGTQITASKEFLSLSDFKTSINSGILTLTWNASKENTGWIVSYTVDGIVMEELNIAEGNMCEVAYIPNVTYSFTVKAADGSEMMNHQYSYESEPAPTFNNYSLGAEHIDFIMYETPRGNNWNYNTLRNATSTTRFRINGRASFLLAIRFRFDQPADPILITYAIYDADGNYISFTVENKVWNAMWTDGFSVLNIPALPSVAGSYQIAILFNGALVNQSNFTITN